jgi:glycosyltransferase involved in cell wall biosynthesis
MEPLDPTERRKLRRELGVEGSTPLLISVGRLHPQKAIPDLLCALARLRDEGIDFALRLAGAGPSGALVQEEIARLRLADRVTLLGVRRDIPRLLGASDLYVSSSLWEGLPVATLEAMAAGLPVVATAVGDVPYAVTPETGTLVEPGDVEALADAVARMLRDKERRALQGAAARRRAREHFGREAWIERILAIYLSLPGVGPDEATG